MGKSSPSGSPQAGDSGAATATAWAGAPVAAGTVTGMATAAGTPRRLTGTASPAASPSRVRARPSRSRTGGLLDTVVPPFAARERPGRAAVCRRRHRHARPDVRPWRYVSAHDAVTRARGTANARRPVPPVRASGSARTAPPGGVSPAPRQRRPLAVVLSRAAEERGEDQLGRSFRDGAVAASCHGDGDGGGALPAGALLDDRTHPAHIGVLVGGDRTSAEDDPVDVEEPDEVRGARSEDPGRLGDVAACVGGQAERLDAAAPAAAARGAVQLERLVAELPGPGAGPAVHGSPEDESGAEAGAQVEVGEVGVGPFPQGETEGGGVGVLVDDDGQPGVLGEGVAQRVAVP